MVRPQIKILTFVTLVTLTQIAQGKDLTFAGQEFPPLHFEDKGATVGASVEFFKEACAELKHNCKFLTVPTARLNKMLEAGEIDGIFTSSKQTERDAYGTYIDSVAIPTNKTYMARVEYKVPPMKSIKELAGKTVVTVRDSANSKLAKKHNEEIKTMIIKEEVDYLTIVNRMKNDQYGPGALIIASEDTARFLSNREGMPIENVLIVDKTDLGSYLSKKNFTKAESDAFAAALASVKSKGTMKKILDKYK